MKRSFEYYHIMVTKKATTEILSNFVSSFKLFFALLLGRKGQCSRSGGIVSAAAAASASNYF